MKTFLNCQVEGELIMTAYCEVCGEELTPEEEEEGICETCKVNQKQEYKYEEDKYDPGIA